MRLFKYKIWSQHLSVFLDLNILRKYVFRVFSRVFSYLKVKTLENDYRSKYSYLLKFEIGWSIDLISYHKQDINLFMIRYRLRCLYCVLFLLFTYFMLYNTKGPFLKRFKGYIKILESIICTRCNAEFYQRWLDKRIRRLWRICFHHAC